MDLLNSDVLSGLLAIVLLDLVLAGDNAIVIAMAARALPQALQRRAVFWGSFGAIAVRLLLTAVVVYLLELPGLMLAGGALLLPIAWKLLQQNADAAQDVAKATTFWGALRVIIIADALMGVDNVLAIAGASRGHLALVAVGLLISVPLVVWGSTLILKLIERFPIIVYVGAGAIAWTAGHMMASDPLVADWFDARHGLGYALQVVLVMAICGGGRLVHRRSDHPAKH
jgi:YjbE family integral membrane protein